MKKVKLLFLFALVVAFASAFGERKTKVIFRVTDPNGFHWEENQPSGTTCKPVTSESCSYTVQDSDPLPPDNTEPSSGSPSTATGRYQP